MTRLLRFVVVLSFLVGLFAGCGGRPQHRIKEVEGRNGGVDILYSLKYDANNMLEEIEYEVEGDRQETWNLKWDGSSLVEIEIEPRTGDDTVHTLTWEGGRLVTRVVERGDSTTTTEYTYDGAGNIETTVSETEFDGEKTGEFETEYTYSGSGQLESTVQDGYTEFLTLKIDQTYETEYEYNGDGRLETLKQKSEIEGDNQGTTRTDYEYDDQGRLEMLEREGDDFDLSYDDQGRLEEIDIEDGFDYDIVYDEGSVSGLTFDPWAIPGAAFFDLHGSGYSAPSPTSFSSLIGL